MLETETIVAEKVVTEKLEVSRGTEKLVAEKLEVSRGTEKLVAGALRGIREVRSL